MLHSAHVVGITSLDTDVVESSTRTDNAGASPPVTAPSTTAVAATGSTPLHRNDNGSSSTSPHGERSQAGQDGAPPAPPRSPQTAEEQEPPIEELVNKAVIHTSKPIEHLPSIAPQELKLIGRCVTFKGDTTADGETRSFYYKGLVGTINKETVMLIYVHRYTEEDFQLHNLQLRHASNSNGNNEPNGKDGVQDTMEGESNHNIGCGVNDFSTGVESQETAPATTREEREARCRNVDSVTDGGMPTRADGNDFDFDHTTGAPRMEEPQLLNELGETHAEATTRVRNRMRGHRGSMGPIPYVTFSRSRIHRVEFGVDPSSSFYSIFQDPTKLHFDMQCLRMFVRRYLIHTSQGNNPRMVSLRAFITCRCNCPDLDNNLLIQTAKEELAHLIKIDREVKRAKKKKEQGRRNILRTYRAPNGLFRNTGVLYLTHLPRQTFMIGVMEVVIIVVLLAYEIVNGLSTELSVVAPYLVKIYPYVFASVLVSVIGTACTLLHAVRMCIPIAGQLYLSIIRGLFTFGAVACATMTIIVVGEMANIKRWLMFYKKELPQERLCYFYFSHRCSGIFESCVTMYNSSECQCPGVESPNEFYPFTCDTQIVLFIQRTTIPLVCVSFAAFVTYLFDGYLHLRLFQVAHLLQRRM